MKLSNKNNERVELYEHALFLWFFCVMWFWRKISCIDIDFGGIIC